MLKIKDFIKDYPNHNISMIDTTTFFVDYIIPYDKILWKTESAVFIEIEEDWVAKWLPLNSGDIEIDEENKLVGYIDYFDKGCSTYNGKDYLNSELSFLTLELNDLGIKYYRVGG